MSSCLYFPLNSHNVQIHTEGMCTKSHTHAHTRHTVHFVAFRSRMQAHTTILFSWQACLFQIIPSDKINATVYEVIALIGHTALRWHNVLHTFNMTPFAYCPLSSFFCFLFLIPSQLLLVCPGGQSVIQWNWQAGSSQSTLMLLVKAVLGGPAFRMKPSDVRSWTMDISFKHYWMRFEWN